MTQIIDENSEIHPPERSAPPHSTPAADDISAAATAAPTPPPLPALLQDLTERARGYIEAASSANTRNLRLRLEAFCRLVPAPEFFAAGVGSGNRRPLHHRLRVRFSRAWRQSQQRLDDRASSGCHRLELCAARHPLDRKDRAIATVIGRGSSDATCPVAALENRIKFAKLAKGGLFRRVTRQSKNVGTDRLNDQKVARLVKKTALAASVRGDLSEAERGQLFAGHSLRAGLAPSTEVDERHVQKQLGQASAEMTRRYQRQRDRFRVNLTKAVGL